jgi:alpha-galactosidase
VRLEITEGRFSVVSPDLRIENAIPVVNGDAFDGARWTSSQAKDGITTLQCSVPIGSFHVEIGADESERIWLCYWLEDVPQAIALMSFGLRFDLVGEVRAFLRNGYFSWDGSYYVALEDITPDSSAQGYAMAQFLPVESGGRNVVLGFDRHDRYQQPFTLHRHASSFTLTIETLWDEKDRRNLARCEAERLVMFDSREGVEDTLRAWAAIVAEAMEPRMSAPRITGWCSWYNLYAAITEENILEHLRGVQAAAERDHLSMCVFQIDDGFTPEMGDWLDVKPQFPRGMKPLLGDIRAAGFTPGLWIAPFMVGNRSRLYCEHPDWVVKDRATGEPLAHMRFYGEFRWHKRSEEYYILDTTHPDAFEYLRGVFRIWRNEWGCDYFKTDFMHFGSEYGPDRAVWHQPGMTRIEIWRRTAQMIRDEIGDALWLGCGCPLWASVGLVDAARIGRDVGVQWQGERFSAQSLLRDQATRNFGNGILWQADPDCILLRERFHSLTDVEVRSLAIYAGMSGGLVMTSDNLSELSPERLRLWRLLLSDEKAICKFPQLGAVLPTGAPDPVLFQVRTAIDGSDLTAMLILNTGDEPTERSYGLGEDRYLYNWTTGDISSAPMDGLTVRLEAHDCTLIFLSPTRLNGMPERLP